MSVDLNAPSLYANRELSWLQFNRRVLSLATRPAVPLLERLKFVAITDSNLDEFFMVRIGGLERERRLHGEDFHPGPDGYPLNELLDAAWSKARGLIDGLCEAEAEVLAQLAELDVALLSPEALSQAEDEELHDYFRREVAPCLTPIAIDKAHPFPVLPNGRLTLALRLEGRMRRNQHGRFERLDGELFALVQVPSVLPRFVRLSGGPAARFLSLEDLIARFSAELFPGHEVLEAAPFRLTRASDLDIAEDEIEDLLSSIEDELRHRDKGEIVRVELDERASPELSARLTELLDVPSRQVIRTRGVIGKKAFFSIYGGVSQAGLRDEPFTPMPAKRLRYAPTIFRSIREGDILLHHPYDSYRHVVDFMAQAAADPRVVAIKQTLYRTSGDSPVVRALKRAAEAGKQVTALVELKARFDEANNIAWARELEESGVHVVYGLIGLKTHSKILLVTRRENKRLKRYLHLGTGNYNPSTAKLYTDLGMFTARDDITYDAMQLFNVLTGYAELPALSHLIVAPFTLRSHTLACIRREIKHAKAGRPSGIKAQMNSLVDGEVIRALYEASRAGVQIDLMVRGICCLRPQLPGVSENIRVHSILDRFLEHSRIFWWHNGGEEEVYLSSADWMPRNLNKRIEVCFPVLDPVLKRRVVDELLPTLFADNSFGWRLQADGQYQLCTPAEGEAPVRAQAAFIQGAKTRGAEVTTPSLRPEGNKRRRLSPAARAALAQQRRQRSR